MQHFNADALLRLPLYSEKVINQEDETSMFVIKQIETLPVTTSVLREKTQFLAK